MKKIGLVGCGAMGTLIARHVVTHLSEYYSIAAVSSLTLEEAAPLANELGVPALSLEDTIAACDILVESACAAAMPGIVRATLAAGREVVCLSVGGFVFDPALRADVMRQPHLVHIPTGAIAGLDGINVLREIGLESSSITTIKKPESLGLTDLSELPLAHDSRASADARIVFEGSAAEAIKRFPANVNVAVSLSLAGMGFDATRVRLLADPQAKGTRHLIDAKAGDCELHVITVPTPLKSNPRSSALAVYSVPALLREIAGKLRIAG